jgi:methionyl-tRNA formyltransferase
MRIIFMGTAPFACPTLRTLLASPHQIMAVVTQPDRPRGRGQHAAASAVKALALEHHLTILQPVRLRPAAVVDTLASCQPDVIVVVAYGNLLPSAVLALPPYGCINLHASLLPKYRGAAPVHWALIQGETVTGYTIMQMDEHLDTGPMLWREECAITPEDDALSLGVRLAEAGAKGMLEVLTALERGTLTAQPQPEAGASYAPKLTRELSRLNWHQPAVTLHNLVRGLVPWPGATTGWRGTEVKIWRTRVHAAQAAPAVQAAPAAPPPGTITAVLPEGLCVACGVDQLLVQELQPANRRRMSAREFVQGYRAQPGESFDQDHGATNSAADSAPDTAHA